MDTSVVLPVVNAASQLEGLSVGTLVNYRGKLCIIDNSGEANAASPSLANADDILTGPPTLEYSENDPGAWPEGEKAVFVFTASGSSGSYSVNVDGDSFTVNQGDLEADILAALELVLTPGEWEVAGNWDSWTLTRDSLSPFNDPVVVEAISLVNGTASVEQTVSGRLVGLHRPRGSLLILTSTGSGKLYWQAADVDAPNWISLATTVEDDSFWTALGDIAVASGEGTAQPLPVGDDGQVLYANSANDLGVGWDDLPVSVNALTSGASFVQGNGTEKAAGTVQAVVSTGSNFVSLTLSVASGVFSNANGDGGAQQIFLGLAGLVSAFPPPVSEWVWMEKTILHWVGTVGGAAAGGVVLPVSGNNFGLFTTAGVAVTTQLIDNDAIWVSGTCLFRDV